MLRVSVGCSRCHFQVQCRIDAPNFSTRALIIPYCGSLRYDLTRRNCQPNNSLNAFWIPGDEVSRKERLLLVCSPHPSDPNYSDHPPENGSERCRHRSRTDACAFSHRWKAVDRMAETERQVVNEWNQTGALLPTVL